MALVDLSVFEKTAEQSLIRERSLGKLGGGHQETSFGSGIGTVNDGSDGLTRLT